MPTRPPRKTIPQLEQEVQALQAQLHTVTNSLENAGRQLEQAKTRQEAYYPKAVAGGDPDSAERLFAMNVEIARSERECATLNEIKYDLSRSLDTAMRALANAWGRLAPT